MCNRNIGTYTHLHTLHMICDYDFKSHMISRKGELYIINVMVLEETDLKKLQYAVVNYFAVKSE